MSKHTGSGQALYRTPDLEVLSASLNDGKPAMALRILHDRPGSSRVFFRSRKRIDSLFPGMQLPLEKGEQRESAGQWMISQPPGRSLANLFDRGGCHPEDCMTAATALIDLMEELHRGGHLITDLNPALLWYRPDEGRFRFVHLLSAARENFPQVGRGYHTGTLRYIAPEQTGRTPGRPDYRSNYYSLGLLLYQLFTGQAPLGGTDTLALLHEHLALQPASPHQVKPELGRALSEVILKLLAKNPDERYQSLYGLRQDLEQAWQLRQKGALDLPMELGLADFPPHFVPPQQLVGREKLMKRFFELTASPKALVYLYGPEGIGKSTFLQTAEKQGPGDTVWVRAHFAGEQRLPFQAFRDVLKQLADHLVTMPGGQRAALERKLRNDLGNLQEVLLRLAPDLSVVFASSQEKLPSLDGPAGLSRLQYAFGQFLKTMANPRRPVILVLEDLDRADNTSLRLLEGLLTDSEMQFLAVVGTYRARPAFSDAFQSFSDRLHVHAETDETFAFERLELEPLSKEALAQLLESFDEAERMPLVDLLHAKTGGIPVFVHQLLRQWAGSGVFQADVSRRLWRADTEAAAQTSVTRNVVGQLEERLRSLPEQEMRLLQRAAVIGMALDPYLLEALSDLQPETFLELLFRLESEGLLFRSSPGGTYRFAHRRLLERVARATDPGRRAAWQEEVLNVYLAQLGDAEYGHHLFTLAAYAQGVAPERRAAYAPLLAEAGRSAIRQSAFDDALSYYRHVLEGRPQGGWTGKWFSYHVEAAEAAIFAQQYALAEHWLGEIREQAATQDERIEWYYLQALNAVSQGRMKETVEVALDGLNELGVRFAFEPPLWRIVWSIIRMNRHFGRKTRADIEALPTSSDPRSVHYNRLLMVAAPAIYFAAPKLLALIAELRMVDTLQKGLQPYSPSALVGYGFLLSSFTPQLERGYRVARIGMDLNPDLGLAVLDAPNRFLFSAFVEHAHAPLHDTAENLLDNYRTSREVGNINMAFYSLGVGLHYLLYSGESLDRLEELSGRYLPIARDAGQLMIAEYLRQVQQFIFDLKRDRFDGRVFDGPHVRAGARELAREIDRSKNSDTTLRGLYIALAYLQGRYADIYEPGERILAYNRERGHNTVHANFNLFFILAARLKEGQAMPRRLFRKLLKPLERTAAAAPANYGALHRVLEGLWYETRGGMDRADRAYRQAYDQVQAGKNPFTTALVAEEYGRFLFHCAGQPALGAMLLREAFATYGRWQARAVQDRLQRTYPELGMAAAGAGPLPGAARPVDLDSVLKAASTLSREIRQQPLLDRLLGVLVENAGAARAAFLVPEGEQLQVLAVKEAGEPARFLRAAVSESDFPLKAVQYVLEKQRPLLLEDAVEDRVFGTDRYIRAGHIHSLACFPLLRQGELKALIYLENKWSPRVFGPDRLELLELLSSQMTISYENAQLYEQLEEKVLDRTRQLNEEKEKVDSLLRNIMPGEVADELKRHGRARARRYEEASVMFTDFKSFTLLAQELKAEDLVDMLDHYFSEFDRIIRQHGLEKIKTIGDAYMCAGGIPRPKPGHCHSVVRAALAIRDYVEQEKREREAHGRPYFEVRVGIHTGPVVAGIVGQQKFAYDIWGETVNLAARMESNGRAGRINVSEAVYRQVQDEYRCTFHGTYEVRSNRGWKMYWLERKDE